MEIFRVCKISGGTGSVEDEEGVNRPKSESQGSTGPTGMAISQ